MVDLRDLWNQKLKCHQHPLCVSHVFHSVGQLYAFLNYTHSFRISNLTMHKPTEELRLTFSSPKLKNPTNGSNWLILGQLPTTELINYGCKFGY